MAVRLQEENCCSAETGTLVFAIINVIAVSLAVLSSVVGLIYWSVMAYVTMSSPDSFRDMPEIPAVHSFLVCVFIVGVMMCAMVAMVFAVFLVHGIVKKRPEHIKAYFIYGVVVNILSSLALILAMVIVFTFDRSPNFKLIVGVLLGCLGYSMILYMIRVAYKKLEDINNQFNHKPLQNANC